MPASERKSLCLGTFSIVFLFEAPGVQKKTNIPHCVMIKAVQPYRALRQVSLALDPWERLGYGEYVKTARIQENSIKARTLPVHSLQTLNQVLSNLAERTALFRTASCS